MPFTAELRTALTHKTAPLMFESAERESVGRLSRGSHLKNDHSKFFASISLFYPLYTQLDSTQFNFPEINYPFKKSFSIYARFFLFTVIAAEFAEICRFGCFLFAPILRGAAPLLTEN